MPQNSDYEYLRSRRFFAQTADGLEALAAEELERLGATDAKTAFRGVYFTADPDGLYRINYSSSLITRVLAPLVTFDCHSARYLYKTARNIDWSDFLDPSDSFAVSANVSNSAIRHSQYAALRVKDAMVDQFRDRTGKRPDVDTREPDVWINLFLHHNRAVLSFDTSGGSLHRRGYRLESVEAPMQETVAAAVVVLSGWDGSRRLYDPMCGSGTLLCEAALRYCRIPPGYLRARRDKFGMERLPGFDPYVWKAVRRAEDEKIRPLAEGLIGGSDQSAAAVAAAAANTGAIPHGDRIQLKQSKFEDLPPVENAVLVCNPPYGLRIGRSGAGDLAGRFGDFLKQRCKGSEAYVYFGKRELIKHIGLRATWKKPLKTGALDGRVVKYELY
ncbi:MAG: THUMP domain-containing protein [Candidatus Latescibacterota bacterium]|jgi:putative N6-adenine-specific DNA methylase